MTRNTSGWFRDDPGPPWEEIFVELGEIHDRLTEIHNVAVSYCGWNQGIATQRVQASVTERMANSARHARIRLHAVIMNEWVERVHTTVSRGLWWQSFRVSIRFGSVSWRYVPNLHSNDTVHLSSTHWATIRIEYTIHRLLPSLLLASHCNNCLTLTIFLLYCIIHCIFYCISIIHCIFTFICIFILLIFAHV